MDKLRNKLTDSLFEAILSLDSVDECYAFFSDLCTVAELQEMSRRLEAAKMLDSGNIYAEVSGATGLSTATISRVSRCLKYGNDGYRLIIDRAKAASQGKAQQGSENGA